MNENTKSKGPIIAIAVIAIVVVAAVIAMPIIFRQVETNNRSEDVKNARAIADIIVRSASSGTGDVVMGTPVYATPDTVPEMKTQPFSKGNVVGKDEPFVYYYVKQGNSCAIYIGDDRTYNLNNDTQAQQYINK